MRTHSECGAFVDHLRLEHRHLREAVRGTVVAIEAWRRANGHAERGEIVFDQLHLLRDQIVNHFREEESGGCMEEAVSRCPSISLDAKAVEAEHPILHAELERIIGRVKSLSLPTETVASIESDFREFAKRLSAHEAAENRILRYGFGSEAADADVDLECCDE